MSLFSFQGTISLRKIVPLEPPTNGLCRHKSGLSGFSVFRKVQQAKQKMVGLSGLEPPTSRLSGGRSNLLSYTPLSLLRWDPQN